MKSEICQICGSAAPPVDVLDLYESNHDDDVHFPLIGIPVYYHLCPYCGFCFAPMFQKWTHAEFARLIYNADYTKIDAGYGKIRPIRNAEKLIASCPVQSTGFRHLDFGGGGGELSAYLREQGWDSTNYDLYAQEDSRPIEELGLFDIVTAYEVMEHVPDPQNVVRAIKSVLNSDGVFLFSTLLHDGHIEQKKRITWWYAGPRAGHISLFSKASLGILAESNGMSSMSHTKAEHAMYMGKPPSWIKRYKWEAAV